MRKTIKVISSAGSVAMLLAGTAMAVPPAGVGFDNWAVNGTGNIATTVGGTTNPCPTNYTCQELASGTGFLQQQITETATGKKYFWTIIAEGPVSTLGTDNRPFTSEDFVQLGTGGSSVPGLYANQRINEGTVSPTNTAQAAVTNGFSTSTQISTGWAVINAANSAETDIKLNLSDRGVVAANDEFLSAFNVKSATPALGGPNVVSELNIDQAAWIGDTTAAAAPSDKQRFYTKLVASSGASPVGGFTFTPGGGAAVTVQGTPIDWAAGDKIQVVWVGQTIGGLGSFGAENLIQVTGSTLGTVSSSSTTAPGPWDWTAGTLLSAFGTGPTF